MDEKLLKLLERIKLENSISEFKNGKLEKIIVNNKAKSWVIVISNDCNIPYDFYCVLNDAVNNSFDVKCSVRILPSNVNYEYLNSYFNGFAMKLLKDFSDRLTCIDGKYYIEVYNNFENDLVSGKLDDLNNLLFEVGYPKIEVYFNEKVSNLIKEEIEKEKIVKIDEKILNRTINNSNSIKDSRPTRMPITSKKVNDDDVIVGIKVSFDKVKVKDIVGENEQVCIEGEIFKVDYFEPNGKNFCIITLTVTDYTDSIYCKLFSKPGEGYDKLKKSLEVGKWFVINGATKIDQYMHNEIVLNVKDINVSNKKHEDLIDDAPEKRIELHLHTMMSQMDGCIDASSIVKKAYKMGYEAIGITDHHGAQAYPDLYHTVTDINKKLKEGEKPFKVIYGTELVLVDDNVDIVIRGNDTVLLDNTYVVFDFETTGFNAGAGDSIIEIGAVKIKDGEIIDTFDELINPKRALSKKITEITNITDDMLIDCPSEEESVKRFIEWMGDLPMVAHNAKFDTSFLEMAYKKYNLGEFTNTVIDTLELSRIIDNSYGRHSLSLVTKRYNIEFDEDSHHRADYDAKATALVFHKMMKKLEAINIFKISDLDTLVSKDDIHKYGKCYHINILTINRTGLKNLFKIISLANTKYLYKTPRILRSELVKYREGLLLGSGCYESEVFVEARSKSDDELATIISFYDYVEVQPPECYDHLVQNSDFKSSDEVIETIKKIVRIVKENNKMIVATGDVHHFLRNDKITREIIVNQKVPGGGRHPLARNGITDIPSMHFRTTNEMLDNFKFLGEELAREIVITNTKKLSDMIEIIEVIIETGGIPFSPKIENSVQIVNDLVYNRAHSIYGEDLPLLIKDRIEQELSGIIRSGFDVIYLIAQKLVKKSNDDGYLVGSRGSVGSSFVATMMGITEVNPLPAHYVCPNCKYTVFTDDNGDDLGKNYSSGYDLPDKECPKCHTLLNKEGQDMPFATFLGFEADKVPDIDLNFSGEYQWKAHEYTKELFGVDNVYRAGTIGTVADKTAFGFVKGYFEDKEIKGKSTAEVERLASTIVGIKRTTGQHPGGIVVIPEYMEVSDFTPFQYPADDPNSLWRTTHFDYHPLEQDILKLDILGHDDPTMLKMLGDLSGMDVTKLPMDDKKVMSVLSSPEALGVTEEQIKCPTGTLGLPELGTGFVINMLTETKPSSFAELVKISGLSHGTDVWAGNASELIKNKVCAFKEVIGCRDDIMVYLSYHGVKPKDAFKIMEFVRKGKASKDPEGWEKYKGIMIEAGIVDWFIDSCYKIKYMFPKAHACAYVMSALRIAWFKVYKPIWYYATYFSVRATDFDIDVMIKGYQAIKLKIEDLELKGYDKTNKESAIMDTLMIALEATARGIKFSNIDINESDSTKFLIKDENTLIPPFRVIDGLGETVSKTMVEERGIKPFMDIEDLKMRGKLSQTLIEKLKSMGMLDGMNESSQLTLF